MIAAANISIFQVLAVPIIVISAVFGVCKSCNKFGWNDRLYDYLHQGEAFKAGGIMAGIIVFMFLIVWLSIYIIELLERILTTS